MSITTALQTAVSGLTAASRGVQLVANNVANAGTEGYARRELQLSSLILGNAGHGVRITGIERVENPQILGDLRLADASSAGIDARLQFRTSFQRLIGEEGASGSLSALTAQLSAALVEAANRPDSQPRLNAVASAAADVVQLLNRAADEVQAARMQADQAIGSAVTWLNTALEQVQALNVQIIRVTTSGGDASGLLDERGRLVGQISEWVPVRELPRAHGAVALMTPSGAMLLDGSAAQIGFQTTNYITADMVVGGALSGLTLNGRDAPMTNGEGRLGGGRLGALFDIRDGLAVEAQELLDGYAQDLYLRFADPAADPSLPAGAAGLFTDHGSAFDPANLAGLSDRLRLNALIDPSQGGEVWRLRDGLYAASQGPVGDGSQLLRLVDALEARLGASPPFSAAAQSAGRRADELAALWAGGTHLLETRGSHISAQAVALRALVLQDGVDTDAEMQKLLMLEKAYGANARVIATVDELIRQLLSI